MQTTYARLPRLSPGGIRRRVPWIAGLLAAVVWLSVCASAAAASHVRADGSDVSALAQESGAVEGGGGCDADATETDPVDDPADDSEEDARLAAHINDRVEWLYRRLMLPLLVLCGLSLALFVIPRVRRTARATALPAGPRTPFLTFLLAAFGYFAFTAAGVFIGVGLKPAAGDYAAPLAALGGQAFALALLLWMVHFGLRMPLGAIGLTGRRPGVILAWAVVLYFAQLPGLLGCMQVAGHFFPREVQPQVLDIARHPEWLYRGLYGVAVVALAPVFEELLFRGLVFHWLRRVSGPLVGVVGSALLFMVVHTPEAYIPIFWLGLVLALAYHYTGSLVAPIAIHLLHNLGQFVVLLWATSST